MNSDAEQILAQFALDNNDEIYDANSNYSESMISDQDKERNMSSSSLIKSPKLNNDYLNFPQQDLNQMA